MQLRQLARQITKIIRHYIPEGQTGPLPMAGLARIHEALMAYAGAIEPWAHQVAGRMLTQVERRDLTAWQQYTEGMGKALRQELRNAPVGEIMRELLAEQVDLITSLPREASQYVHEWTRKAQLEGQRFASMTEQVAGQLRATPSEAFQEALENASDPEEFLLNRATLIARTETARTASKLVEARSKHIGSNAYVWKTAGDARVRESHRRLNNSLQLWSDPPLSDPPDHHSHPGQIWNCRCVALPVVTGELEETLGYMGIR